MLAAKNAEIEDPRESPENPGTVVTDEIGRDEETEDNEDGFDLGPGENGWSNT